MNASSPTNPNPGDLLQQLRQSLGLLQVAFDAAREAMVIVDGEQRVRWTNQAAAALWGAGMAMLLPGMRLNQLVQFQALDGTPIGENESHHPLQALQHGDGGGSYRLCFPELIGAEISSHQISWKQINQVADGYGLITIGDLDPAEKALQEQRTFMNQLAHELRTPLAIVSGSLKRIERKGQLHGGPASHLAVAKQEVVRMARLLDNLTLLSELETGQYQWQSSTVPVHGLLSGWMQNLDEPSRARLSLNLMGCSPQSALQVDATAFGLILDNLLNNSLRYSAEDAPILLMATGHGASLDIFFMDWGAGIPEHQQGKVFDRFHRLEETRDASNADGAGLGLTLVRQLVEGMGGEIDLLPTQQVNPQQPSGTVLRLRFPCTQIPQQPVAG